MDASSNASSSSSIPELRPEAGPLPTKRGEIGFQGDTSSTPGPQPEVAPLPERHPADRDHPTSAQPTSTSSNPDDASSNSSTKRIRILAFFKPKKVLSCGGILLTTLIAFLLQLSVVAGTITAWVVSVQFTTKGSFLGGQRSADSDSNTNNSTSSIIFIHVVFGIATVGQLLFLERRIYRIRAERYAHLHPGEILPTSRPRNDHSLAISLSPWNRPPLPTYAAALAHIGTGDVEDNIIAAPPPPAYGNNRGSILLLSGFLNDSQRLDRPVSTDSQMSQNRDRPVSYKSCDEDWEIIQDAHRSMQLEQTLARLERPASRT